MKIMKIMKNYICLLLVIVFAARCNNDTQPQFPTQTIIPVGPSDASSAFSYYNTTPENPTGNKIAYVKYLETPTARVSGYKGEIWTCDANLQQHQKVVSVDSCHSHNGVSLQWIDDDRFAYQDGTAIYIASVGQKEVLHGPYYGRIGHYAFDEKILFANLEPSDEEELAIFEVNANDGKAEKIAPISIFYPFQSKFHASHDSIKSNWRILHLHYSPDGSKINLRLDVGEGEVNNPLFTISRNEIDPVVYFGLKPMHFDWYDNQSIMGHDNQIPDGMPNDFSARRWDLQGNFIETLAGPGNHLGAAPDFSRFASESWYRSDTISLSVFNRGEIKPFFTVDVSNAPKATWDKGWHVNPSFSRDGKRVYFHRTVSNDMVQACMVVLE